ncbi:shikimate kinase [Flagellimonas aquimarina]|uniref:Shikimate kinase n=1 Tax=Flagellimonas aquimarina TaxID=2201895 RepID=A0A316KUQ2_9FLAO|nr:shikimate kinase [Allomuricauda koreensis]PWL37376.1 shikimate kinase [Allomuricauda koreensis]
MKVVLVGYMASGKSSIGRLLARDLNLEFIDLDEFIENQLQKTIPAIFSEKGEIYFRKIEHEMLSMVLNEKQSVVLSTGGGTPCYGGNMKTILEQSNHSLYLQLPVSTLVDRISNEKNDRPLVKNIDNGDLLEFVGKHLFERRQFYAQAKHIVDADKKSIEVLVDEIKKILL